MPTIRSFSPVLDRMSALDRVIDQAFSAAPRNESRAWIPAIDVVEKRDAYSLYVELPGVQERQTEIVLEQNVLAIRGVKSTSIDTAHTGDVRVFAAERTTGVFERSVRLPDAIDGSAIVAEFSDGLLTITIPKAKSAQPRRIEIKSSGRVFSENAGSNADRADN